MSDSETQLFEAAKEPKQQRSALARLDREVNFGVLQSIPSARLTQYAVDSGYQFIIFDCEHDDFTNSELEASACIIEGKDVLGIVRLDVKDVTAVPRYLEHGAHGIVLAHVREASEVECLVNRARRGEPGPSPLLLALIETAQAIDNIDAISATRGVHGLLIGPHDLSKDLGVSDDFSSRRYCSAFAQIEQAARRAGLLLGTRPHPGFSVQRLREGGHTLILLGSDSSVVASGYIEHLKSARGQWQSSEAAARLIQP